MPTNLLDRVSPYLLLTLTTLFWAGNFNIARALSPIVPALGLSFWRWLVASCLLLPFAWQAMRTQWPLFKQHWLLVLMLALLGITGFNSLVYVGLDTTTVTNGVLLQSINPIVIMLLATVFLHEQARLYQWLGILLSLAGVLIILAHGELALLQNLSFKLGDLLILGAVGCWSVYTILLRKVPEALKGLPLLGYTITFGTLFILPLYALESVHTQPMPFTPVSVAGIAYVAIFPSLLAYLFWNHATNKLGASRAGQFSHLVPVFGILIATLGLGERLQSFHFIGSLLVAAGLLLTNLKGHRTNH